MPGQIKNHESSMIGKNGHFDRTPIQSRSLSSFSHSVMLTLSPDQKLHEAFSLDPASVCRKGEYKDMICSSCDMNEQFIDRIFEKGVPVRFVLSELVQECDVHPFFRFNYDCGMEEVLICGLNNGRQKSGILMIFFGQSQTCPVDVVDFVAGILPQLATAMANILANERIGDQVTEIAGYRKRLEAENHYLQEEIQISQNYNQIIGASHALKNVFNLISRVAHTNSSVLILGETGTGKELIARAIHNASARKDRLMVKINCAALPANLIESELFGHEKGSFTGAIEKRVGKFELADNSTLFLDEVGELPLDVQSKLLRTIQEREIERVGGRNVIKTDVRILAATNRDLQEEVELGNFRSDLYYRLNVFPITIPPLRDRMEDVPMLAAHFLAKHAKKAGKEVQGFSSSVMSELTSYCWPGNVRELEHLVERSVLMSRESIINEVSLPVSSSVKKKYEFFDERSIKTLDELERSHIESVLRFCDWKIAGAGGAAQILKLPSSTLNSKIKKHGIRRNEGSK